MLEITNLRDGAVLNRHNGIETEEYLEIKVEGLAAPQAKITVNGVPAARRDRQFFAAVRLTERVNKITAASSDYFGERTLTITVLWDKKSFKRTHFFFDTAVSFCVTSPGRDLLPFSTPCSWGVSNRSMKNTVPSFC